MTARRRRWFEAEAGVDLRALGLVRILLGLLLLAYLVTRVWDGNFYAFYTDFGVLPATDALRMPAGLEGFSLFTAFRTPLQSGIAFALVGAAFLAFTVGFRTRVSLGLSLLGLISLHNRNPMTTNASMVLLHGLLAWLFFMPIGRRLSVDAYLLKRDPSAPLIGGRDVAIAFVGFRLHVALIYVMNYVHKSGETWMNGSAVHYMLWQHRYNTDFAYWLRKVEPAWFSPAATYGTLLIEGLLLPVLLLSPFGRKWCRRVAAALMLALHLGIAMVVHLGPFPYVLALFALLLLSGEDWSPVFDKLRAKTPYLPWPAASDASPPEASLDRWARFGHRCREGGAVLFALLLLWQIRDDNPFFQKRFGKSSSPRAVESVIELLHLPQGWQLYTPDTPRVDFKIVVDAERMDGTHIDPLTGRPPDLKVLDGPPPHQNYVWQTYELYLVSRNARDLWVPLVRYLEAVPQVEGWDGDPRFRQIDVWVTKRYSVPLGKPPRPIEKVFATKRERKYDDEKKK